ncbi:MAG: DUF4154 domain-containing protein [Alteromonadales bacterium]|nr:DUF4154 domain-containing protein [Alteromonadales bacterium]
MCAKIVNNNNKGLATLYYTILIATILSLPMHAHAKYDRDTVTAVYIINLAKNIHWPNSANISTYHIHVIDKGYAVTNILKTFSKNRLLHGKKVYITRSSNINTPKSAHIIFIAKQKNSDYSNLLKQIKKRNVLIVSADIEDKNLIMINLFENSKKQLRFEINKANIINQKLGINPDIILLGGTEIDVAKLYKEGQSELQEQQQKRRQMESDFSKETAVMQKKLANQKRAIIKEQADLKQAVEQSKKQQKKLAQLSKEVMKHRNELDTQSKQLKLQQVKFEQQSQQIIKQKQDYLQMQANFNAVEKRTEQQKEIIDKQKEQIATERKKYFQVTEKVRQREDALLEQEKKIAERITYIADLDTKIKQQEVELNEQTTIIGTQKRFLFALVIAVVLAAMFTLLALVSYRVKKQTNLRLQEQNLLLENSAEQLVIARNTAEKANKIKSVFLATMSHELRTPLNAILGFSQIIQMDPHLPANLKEKVTIINRSGEHLLSLINEVLELSKIEAGRVSLIPVAFSLTSMINEVKAMLYSRMEQKGIQFQLKISDKLPSVIVSDQGKVKQVLINLLGNAIKFTEQGRITLRVSLLGEGNSIKASPELQTICFEVQDTGVGIKEQEFKKIFAPFEQASTGLKKENSSGLGLSISRHYAKLMGGDITFNSHWGVGTSFFFEMQAERSNQQIQKINAFSTPLALAPGQVTKRILVVDDIANNRNILEQMLVPIGFEIKKANDGVAAINSFKEWSPDLILMDIKMPVLDGMQAVQKIKLLPNGKEVAIIMVSATVLDETQKMVEQLGLNGFIKKPVEFKDLLEQINRCLGLKYIYQEKIETEAHVALNENYQLLPSDLFEAIQQAALIGDIARLTVLAAEVIEIDPDLGQALKLRLDEFDLATIMQLTAPNP